MGRVFNRKPRRVDTLIPHHGVSTFSTPTTSRNTEFVRYSSVPSGSTSLSRGNTSGPELIDMIRDHEMNLTIDASHGVSYNQPKRTLHIVRSRNKAGKLVEKEVWL